MSTYIARFGLVLLVCMMAMGCGQRDSSSEGVPEIAVTNSYLEAAVRDLLAGNENVLSLAEPGMCPGHFDLSPGTVSQIKKCKLFLRFDFQKGLDEKLKVAGEDGALVIQSIEAPQGLCVPSSYIEVCEQVCQAMEMSLGPDRAVLHRARLERIRRRVTDLGEELQKRIQQTNLKGQTVVSSRHQERFAQWLGMNVAAVLDSQDEVRPGDIQSCLEKMKQCSVRLILANRQEGTRLAERLAEESGAQVVVLSNFPESKSTASSGAMYDQLLRKNVDQFSGEIHLQ